MDYDCVCKEDCGFLSVSLLYGMWSHWAKACSVEMTLNINSKDSFKFVIVKHKNNNIIEMQRGKTVLFCHLIFNGFYNNKGKRRIHF